MLDIACIKSKSDDAVTPRCSEGGCELKLDGLKKYIVVKGDKICKDRKICDCIIFTEIDNLPTIGVIELKSKTVHANEVVEKLDNGSKIALDILEKCSDNRLKYEFCHIVLCRRWSSSEYIAIKSRKIAIRGNKCSIIPKRCGVSFSAVISLLK